MILTRKSFRTLLILVLGNILACSTNHESKKNPDPGSAGEWFYRDIEFESQGATLRGRLYVPEDKAEPCPVVVMAHGFTTTINGMTADKYAERFTEAGFAVALYDHRNFGISDGEPRQEINFWVQSRGYLDCIEFVSNQAEVDTSKIAIWGASLSAREAFLVGSIDDRVKAIITQIPAFGEDSPTQDNTGNLFSFAKQTILTEHILDLPHTVSDQMPVVSHDQLGAPSALSEITAYRWFIDYGGRFGTNWKNVVSFSSVEMPDLFHIGQCAPYLKAPILMVVAKNDEMHGADPEITQAVFDMVKQPKEWVDIEGGHFGLLYYPGKIFDTSSKAQIQFLKQNLDNQ